MKDGRQSEYDHQLVLDVPNVVARQIRDMCKAKAEEHSTIASQQGDKGLVNMIDRELQKEREVKE